MKKLAKFEPADGSCLVFIGQDTETIGGLANYSDGYCDYFDMPAGITLYSNLSPGINSYGYITKGNDGLKETANWGAGDSCAKCHFENEKFNEVMLALGVSMVGHEKAIAKGNHDQLIEDLALWVKGLKRPVFLRLGYEFDGWDWNNYSRKHYLNAWRKVHAVFNELEVGNVAFVWQSKGVGSSQEILEEWYPGDEYVDWCGYSYFGNPDTEMLTFARKHSKPVFIAEASPVRENDGLYFSSLLSNPEEADKLWEQWFIPFFETIDEHSDVIKAFSYINTNWQKQIMWKNNPLFKHVDARIQSSEYVSEKWKTELAKPKYQLLKK
ncbi:glycosyl hydrolase [Ekhidna sp.]